MTSALIRKLHHWSPLPPEDRMLLSAMVAAATEQPVRRGARLIDQDAVPTHVFLLIEGWAMRYKILPDGSRQIVGILVPGDLCDIHIFILDRMDHGIAMLSSGRIAAIPRNVMLDLIERHARIARALLWGTLVDEATLREWLVNLGGRDATARTAHLLCELHARMDNIGLVLAGGFELPLTQADMGDALGLTPVHVNRVLRRLREAGYATINAHRVTIHDLAGLRAAAGFDPGYMHEHRRLPGDEDGM